MLHSCDMPSSDAALAELSPFVDILGRCVAIYAESMPGRLFMVTRLGRCIDELRRSAGYLIGHTDPARRVVS
jgi:hypothetical protein